MGLLRCRLPGLYSAVLIVGAAAPPEQRPPFAACNARYVVLDRRDTVSVERVSTEPRGLRLFVEDRRQRRRLEVTIIVGADALPTSVLVIVGELRDDGITVPFQTADVRITPDTMAAVVRDVRTGSEQVQHTATQAGAIPYMAGMVGFYDLLIRRAQHADTRGSAVPIIWLFSDTPHDSAAVVLDGTKSAKVQIGATSAVIDRDTSGSVRSIQETAQADTLRRRTFRRAACTKHPRVRRAS